MWLLLEVSRLFGFAVPQTEYPLGGSSDKNSHVYFLLIIAMLLLLLHHVTMVGSIRRTVISNNSITQKSATGSIHDYLFCYCPLVGILFEVLRIEQVTCYFAGQSSQPNSVRSVVCTTISTSPSNTDNT